MEPVGVRTAQSATAVDLVGSEENLVFALAFDKQGNRHLVKGCAVQDHSEQQPVTMSQIESIGFVKSQTQMATCYCVPAPGGGLICFCW
jgi:hypothetical protein